MGLPQGTGGGANADFMLAVSRGLVSGVTHINKFGRNSNVAAVGNEDVWAIGGVYVPPTAARTHALVSTSANDNSAGTGARSVKIHGLDANWAEISETVTLAGVTPVNTVNAFRRIYRMKVVSAGSNETNVGIISATADIDATVSARIASTNGQSLMAIYAVPAGKHAKITRAYASANHTSGAVSTVIRLMARTGLDTATPALLTKHHINLQANGTSYFSQDFGPYKGIVGPADLFLRVISSSANSTDVTGGFDCFIVDA